MALIEFFKKSILPLEAKALLMLFCFSLTQLVVWRPDDGATCK